MFNGAKFFIEIMALTGQAFNLRRANDDMIAKSKERVKNNLINSTSEHEW